MRSDGRVSVNPDADDARIWILAEGYVDKYHRLPPQELNRTTASILGQLVAEHGCKAVERLAGCFVAVFVFPETGTICAYRDRLGGRTAYWAQSGGRLVLASSSSLIGHALGRVCLDPRWLTHWFSIGWPGLPALTPFANINELLPGEWLEFVDGQVTRQRTPFTIPLGAPRRSPSEWVERFRSAFSNSIDACLPEADDAAVMLSGGMDSGPSATVAAELQRARGRSLTAVSWSLPGAPDADESKYIRSVADALDVPLDLFDAGDCVPYDRLTTDLVVADFPTFNFYREMILRCYERAAARGLPVIINAAMGDLIYPPGNARLVDLWARREGRAWFEFLFARLRARGVSGTWQDANFRHFVGRMLGRLRPRRTAPPPWLTDSAIALLPEAVRWPPEANRHRLPEYASHLIGQAMAWGVAHENLFSQRYGVERSDPFQNEALVRLMLEMPVSMSFRDGTDKWIMREAMRDRMPEEIRTKGRTGLLNSFLQLGFERNREKLRGFLFTESTDWQAWVRPEFVRDVLDNNDGTGRGQLVLGNCVGYSLWLKRLREEGISLA